jgi:nucleoside-diphosphate-sugar epimerase
MKILVVGGTGLIGGDAALRLAAQDHDVTIAARKPAPASTAMAKLPLLQGDYAAGDFTPERLTGFEAIIFAAGNDARHRAPDEDEAAHLERANVLGLPRFFAAARDAGVRRAVYIGSFYPQVKPEMVARSTYVRSRLAADEGARALSRPGFEVVSVNPPYVLGHLDGLIVPSLQAHVRYALGLIPGIDPFAIPGGVNFMSAAALTDAVVGALERGDPGKAYLVGDANMSFQDYFGAFRRAAGLDGTIPIRDEEHPMLPDWSLYGGGRGSTVWFTPDEQERAQLGYRRGDLDEAFAQLVRAYGETRA